MVHSFNEIQRNTVFATLFITLPVDQAAHSIHPQSVKVIFLQPVIGGRLEETGHLPAGVDEIIAAPFAFAHILVGVLIEGGAVKFLQTVGIHGEVNGNKVHDGTNSGFCFGCVPFRFFWLDEVSVWSFYNLIISLLSV